MAFIDDALAEIDGLHRVLQAWFRAEGTADPAPVLDHFDPGFTMVTTGGALTALAMLQAALPRLRGSRPGLVMEIADEALVHAGPGFAAMRYKERQHLNGTFTDRLSTVLMLDRGDGVPVWRHLHETMVA